MTVPRARGGRSTDRTLIALPILTAAISAVALAAAISAAPASVRTALTWVAGTAAAVVVLAVFVVTRAVRAIRTSRAKLRTATSDIERLTEERLQTAQKAQQEHQHLMDELSRQRTGLADSFAHERARLESRLTHELDSRNGENARLAADLESVSRSRDAVLAAAANAAGRLQALTTAMLADLRAMEERHSDEDVLTDLLHLDHRTAQIGRLADGIATLAGARSGRRWARPIAMESILRGAMGRIIAYRRVRIHSASGAAVAGHAAEGVMHALAEILDNATKFSPPTSEVHVYVEEVPAGVIVSVEDSGLVMGDVQLRRAVEAVSGDVSELGGLTGTRLGLAVVGRLSAKYGLRVSFRPSARGGTGVLMLIPQDILSSPVVPERPASSPPSPKRRPAPTTSIASVPTTIVGPARARAGTTGTTDADEVTDGPGATGLPKRHKGRTLAESERTRSMTRDSTAREAPGTEETKLRVNRLSSFRQAVRATPPQAEAAPDPAALRPDTEPDAASSASPGMSSHPTAHPEGNPQS
ncbi:ATP-binding protein [Streptomyces galilaeus]|uniref:sensor histidine kinase n=1 Tax=Streptomyces galilaeus TaxID=33899 RepID=UPI0038F7D1F5